MADSTQTSPRGGLLNQLHAATRSEHAALNKAITARLPLCLPPHASSPYFYAAGITAYAQIYIAMEAAREELIGQDTASNHNNNNNILSSRDREFLSILKTPYLDRSQRIESDLQNLRGMLGPSAAAGLDSLRVQSLPFHDTISDTIRAKPHLLLAYAWPMYLALFNGGRWIASQLLAAGPGYWQTDIAQTAEDFLSFWYFDDSVHDQHHGDNVKVDFKQRLNAVSELLTQAEIDEIVIEVKRVFGICGEMITLLDQHTRTLQLELELEQQEATYLEKGDGVAITGGSILDWMVAAVPVQSAWHNFRSIIGFATAPPASLRKDFEQRA